MTNDRTRFALVLPILAAFAAQALFASPYALDGKGALSPEGEIAALEEVLDLDSAHKRRDPKSRAVEIAHGILTKRGDDGRSHQNRLLLICRISQRAVKSRNPKNRLRRFINPPNRL